MARILLVDDEPELVDQLRRLLESDAHEVSFAHDGAGGLKLLNAGRYDLVVMDWEMPNMSGPQLCRIFREAGGTAAVLMLTGKTSISDKEEGLDAGADDYLTKPFDMKEFAARARALLRRNTRLSESEDSRALWKRVEEAVDEDPFLGTTIAGKYDVLSMIGLGGMGLVYKAHHNVLKRSVALKILFPHLAARPDIRKRFQQEGQAASRLSHPNIVTVYDFGMAARGLPFLVMDFLSGMALSDIIEKESPLDFERSLSIFLQICDGLQHAHEHKVIHRDLKPSNIFIVDANQVKVLDFGLAKPLDDEGGEKLTRTGFVMGSPHYMSPEQCRGEVVDFRSDIYSMGCLMYETLCGKVPFDAEASIDAIKKQIREVPPPMCCPQLTPAQLTAMEYIVMKALSKKVTERYQSMQELKNDLETWTGLPAASSLAPSADSQTPLPFNSMFVLRAFVLVLAAAVLVIGIVLWQAHVK